MKDEETGSHTKVRLDLGDSEDYYEEQNDNQGNIIVQFHII